MRRSIPSIVSALFFTAVLICITAIALAWPVPDTGQTKCYNNSSEITCPQPGEAFYGQDGNYLINPPSYTKLDASGNALPDASTTWTMVKDNITGLIWENKTNDSSIHDGSKTFTWCDKNPGTNGGNQGTCGTGTGDAATDTEAFIKALNDAKFGGFSDWRMPTVKELTSIVDRSRVNPSVNSAWFSNSMSSGYWSSTTHTEYSNNAWYVPFNTTYVYSQNKSSAHAVRVVRGGQSESRYIINGDGIVTDTTTGLMWQQESVSGKTWNAALSYAEGLDLAGYNDWRLPNITELQSIVDYSRYSPAIDTQAFPGTVQSYYWSSTTDTNGNAYAWDVGFGFGNVHYPFSKGGYSPLWQRGVRGDFHAPLCRAPS